jgi:condensin-2 complex subunit G2
MPSALRGSPRSHRLVARSTTERSLPGLLVRLYDPVLPRAFAAANAEVRRNALQLLVAAFPVVVS